MFYSIDKVQRGLARYLDEEIVSKAEGKSKWLMTGMLTLYTAKLPQIVHQFKNNEAIKVLGIISDDGGIDVEAIAASVRPAARKSPMEITLPFNGGTVRFTESDIDMLLDHISHA